RRRVACPPARMTASRTGALLEVMERTLAGRPPPAPPCPRPVPGRAGTTGKGGGDRPGPCALPPAAPRGLAALRPCRPPPPGGDRPRPGATGRERRPGRRDRGNGRPRRRGRPLAEDRRMGDNPVPDAAGTMTSGAG